ncbi:MULTISPECIES: SCO family protein [unclassified Comamonas]|jgi:protein SCO1|uniref:SCO family protein n=1 Tax=unclassified Comamonas TaxID=2638500 RepID=UPI001EFB5D18|nr:MULTISPECIES: SCO family protein [unclassified Comamonas]ULR87831.1 SCO family protein [Comamonas sp. B21-038]
MNKRNALRWLAGSAMLASTAGFLTACKSKADFNAIDLTGSKEYGQDFSMPDQHGQRRSMADFKGKVVLVFFGFTQCPDVCPTTLGDLAAVKQKLGAKGEKLQVIFASVDPARDTPEILQAYLANFDPSFLALRGSDEETAKMAKDFKVYYKRVEGQTPGSYTMDHTAGDYIFDPEGRLRLYSRYGTPVDTLAKDIEQLIDGA